MSKINELFTQDLKVVNLGLKSFGDNIKSVGVKVINVDWKPPAGGKVEILELLDILSESKISTKIEEANEKAMEIVLNGVPEVVGVGIAKDTIPGMTEKTILHAGPPISWDRMCGPVRGGVMGALIYEGLAKNLKEAEELASSGEIKFDPCHHHNTVGPMAGIVSSKMPVWIVKNKTYGNYAYATFNEGLGKVLRFGAYSDDVISHLKWIEQELAPIIKKTLELSGPINLKNIITQALQMGDECHNRNKAATSLLIREIAPYIVETGFPTKQIQKVLKFLNSNDHSFLNLSMPASKSILQAAEWIEYSTLVTTMCRNGTDFGIRVSGLKDMWFTDKCQAVEGLYFSGYSEKDANPDLGDSTICETCGIGGFAMASAPAIVQFVGGSVSDGIKFTKSMYEITLKENNMYKIPALNFRGTPTGIDIRKVVQTQILPIINTGIAHKDPGVGQVGAGLTRPTMKLFEDALKAFVGKYCS